MNREHPLKKFYSIIDNGEPHDKLKALPEFPRIIEMEITNHCNFQCLMCKTGTGIAKRERGYMSVELFDKFLADIEGKGCAVKFVGQGEPTLHPQFIDFVKKAKEKGITCHLTTNGSMFDEEYMKNLIESGLDSVKFSFQGVTAEGYSTLRRKNDFESLLQKIERLYQLRGEGMFPFITIGTSFTSETEEEISSFRRRCEQFCDKIEVGVTTLEYIDLSQITNEQTKEYLNQMKQNQSQNIRRYKCCHQVFDVITVHWNGNICACCADNDEEMVLGNLRDMTISECWNSDKEKAYRNILVERQYEKLPLCKDCYDVYGWTYQENKE